MACSSNCYMSRIGYHRLIIIKCSGKGKHKLNIKKSFPTQEQNTEISIAMLSSGDYVWCQHELKIDIFKGDSGESTYEYIILSMFQNIDGPDQRNIKAFGKNQWTSKLW